MIVVDASVVVELLVGRRDSGRIARRIVADDIAAPDILDLEVASALRGLWLAKRADDAMLAQATSDLLRLSVERHPSSLLVRRALAHRANLTVYDASYVALAELLDCTLITRDRRIAAAPGIRCSVEVL